MPSLGRSTLPISPARLLGAGLLGLALAPAASADAASIRWVSPDHDGDRLRGVVSGDACQFALHAPEGVRRVRVRVFVQLAKWVPVRRSSAQVTLRRVDGGRFACTWNTTAVRNATYRLRAAVRTDDGRLHTHSVTVRVRNRNPQ